ncbi:caspase family protein, partial [Desulfococcaceae bacterium HSG8]|nr:caspase family protein [Desulfococcaceae bacterium HSG8]
AKAEFYLDKTRKALIEQESSDTAPSHISIESPGQNALSNGFTLTVKGAASDDKFVKEIQVNGESVRIDLSAPRIPFYADVPMKIGENSVIVEVTDLAGKTSRAERTVRCDRAGPILNIDELKAAKDSENRYAVRGYAYDTSGIRAIRVNDRSILKHPVPETVFDHPVFLASGQEKVVIIAEDRAGNQTRAEIPRPSRVSDIRPSGSESLLASLDCFPLLSQSDTESDRGVPISRIIATPSASPGKYYALIIGINKYAEWPILQTAVNDAEELKKILVGRYRFPEKNVILRTDKEATRVKLIHDMRKLAAGLTRNDNLLIYFGGHGRLDDLTSDGYWIPAEGKLNDPTGWITNSAIKNILTSEKVKGKNIVVIADSCYSGNLLRGGGSALSLSDQNYRSRILQLARKKSRQIISSGGMEPVADSGRDNHSLFAYYFLKALKENTHKFVDIENLGSFSCRS